LRVVQLAVSDARSGTEAVLAKLAKAVQQLGWHSTALLPAVAALDGLGQELGAAGIGVKRIGPLFAKERPIIKNFLQLGRELRALRPHIVHLHIPWAPAGWEAVLASVAAGVPVVMRTEHNPIMQRLSPFQRTKLALLDSVTQHVVFVSDGNRRRHLTTGQRRLRRTSVIPNGIESSPPLLLSGERLAARRRLLERDVAPHTILVGMAGNMETRKGPLEFVEMAAAIAPESEAIEFVVIGDGAERRRAEALVHERCLTSRFHFLGHRSELRALLPGLDVFVLPSHYEGLSLVMLEACAAGLPLVSTDVDGVEELLGAGAEAVVVPVGDVAALAAGVRRWLSDPQARTAAGSANRRAVDSAFHASRMCDEYVKLYTELAGS
jgi:glycosyltransferase involved in cell wall biosynthesis